MIRRLVPHTTRVELFGGRCACCGARFRAATPEGMSPGTPFGPNIHALLLYLHHSHHVSFERLSRAMNDPDRVKTLIGIPSLKWSC